MNFSYLQTVWELFKTDLFLLSQTLKDKIINAFIWASANILITAYILPALGFENSYGAFMAASVIVTCGGFELVTQLSYFYADIEGENHTSFLLTLPLPNWLILVKQGLFYAFNSFIICIMALITAKVLLFYRLDLSSISFLKLTIALLIMNAFYGSFTLFMIAFTKGLATIENSWMRILFPLWFLGGFQFSWMSLYNVAPRFAYLNLLNPYTHATEMMRAAMISQQGNLPFWYSAGTLLALTFILGGWGIARIRRRLDFI